MSDGEAVTAVAGERLALLDELARVPVLEAAMRAVVANGGMPGIDRVSVHDFRAAAREELPALADELADGAHRPRPVLRVRPRFLGASDRALVVPTVRDRVVQRAVSDLLTPRVEPLLSPACRAFRKGHSAKAAAEDVGRWVADGTPWVLRTDVAGYYDHIRPERLLELLEPLVDEAGLRFLDRLLRCRIYDRDHVTDLVVGIAQGSPLSPLLGNLYLAEVDRAIAERWRRYLRYCDDLIVLAGREEEVREARDAIEGRIEPLGLALNQAKTRICRAEDGFVFLGYHFGPAGRGPAVKAVEALAVRLEELGGEEAPDLAALDAVHRGWAAYFGDHPEVWLANGPAGLLAHLRAAARAPSAAVEAEALLAARGGLDGALPPAWHLELARAWTKAGRDELAWLELAAVAGRLGGAREPLESWAEALELAPEEVEPLVGALAGPVGERFDRLAERLAEAGRYGLARRLATLESDLEPLLAEAGGAPSVEGSGGELQLDDEEIEVLTDFFRGREGVHAVESIDGAGRRRFAAVEGEVDADRWRAHLAGESTLALPLVAAGDLCWLGVLDVDLDRRAMTACHGRPDELLGRALGAAFRLRAELERRGVSALLEDSGRKGCHLWVRLAEPVPAAALRRWMLDVAEAAAPFPEGVRVEVMPNRDRVKADGLGPLIKLPLGVHSASGRRCHLLDRRGEPLAEPVEAVRDLPRLAPDVVRQREVGADGLVAARSRAEVGPRAREMLDGCHVLGFLEKKAAETSYLGHRERLSLLLTLGHLGEEGAEAIHAIISHTYNYKREVTDRHIGRLLPYPISCPKLREIHPEAVARGPCDCPRRPRGKGYPTPVLLAMKPSEIGVFRKDGGAAAERSKKGAAAPAKSPGRKPGGESGAGKATRKRRGGGKRSESIEQRAEHAVRRLQELRRHRDGVLASMERTRAELDALFEEAGAEAIEIASGTLRRLPGDAPETWKYRIEL